MRQEKMRRTFGPATNLRDFANGAILGAELIDVRRVLLADSPVAPTVERDPDFRQLVPHLAGSPITSHDIFNEVFPWPV
jgi:hypothetical protein